MCAKLRTVAASNRRDHPTRSLSSSPSGSTIKCSPGSQALLAITHQDHSNRITLLLLVRATYIYSFVLHAHPIRGESHNQRNTGEVATTSPPFYNEPHRSHVLCVKAELGATSTSWSQHQFVAIGNPERHVRKASHCGSKQQ